MPGYQISGSIYGGGRGRGRRDVADRGRKEGMEEQKKRVPKVPKKKRKTLRKEKQ